MAHLPKLLFVLTMLMPGGFFLAPALLWWMRRSASAERPNSADRPAALGAGTV